jgi:xanthine/uracil permease
LAAGFDGICGSVVGVIAIVALQLLDASVNFQGYGDTLTTDEKYLLASQNALAAVIFVFALAVQYTFTNRYTVILLVLVGAVAGQFLFV